MSLIRTVVITFLTSSLVNEIICPSPPKKLAKCKYDVELLWSKEIGHAPFASSPLITDINADGLLDVVAAPFTDVITVLSGHDGHVLPSSIWPQPLIDRSIHSSPLLYDIDADGLDDILLVTSGGDLLFYRHDGHVLPQTGKLFPIFIQRNWWENWRDPQSTPVESFIRQPINLLQQVPDGYIAADPHVLATPMIADLNKDHVMEELIIPVSYYIDPQTLRDDASHLSVSELNGYLAASLIIFNLTSLSTQRHIHLQLSQVNTSEPAYIVSSPIVMELDGDVSSPEILQATLAGQLHAVRSSGEAVAGFPMDNLAVSGQIAVMDADEDGRLDVLAVNRSGSLVCINLAGEMVWSTSLGATGVGGMRLADINADGITDVVLATSDGNVWAVHSHNGSVLPDWPYRVTKEMTASPLVARLNNHPHLDVVILSDNLHLHIIRGDAKCRHAFKVGELSYVSPLSHDLVTMAPGMEMLVATRDGTLLCLGQKPRLDLSQDLRYMALEGMSAEYTSHSSFMHADGKVGVFIHREDNIIDVTGGWMTLTFDILDLPDKRAKVGRIYKAAVYLGSRLLAVGEYNVPGTYSLLIATPDAPARGHVTLVLTNRHAQVFQDKVAVRFNLLFLHDLQWLLLCPFVAMAIILLFLHGYPAADLLPLSRSKDL